MNIYHVHDFKEDEYSWNEVGRRKAKKNSYIRWLIMIVSFVILFIAAYLEFRYDLLEINGFLCWLLAILVFSWGFTICIASNACVACSYCFILTRIIALFRSA